MATLAQTGYWEIFLPTDVYTEHKVLWVIFKLLFANNATLISLQTC